MIEAAKEYPEVQFSHATGTKAHTEGLDTSTMHSLLSMMDVILLVSQQV